jgi:hypothetical protein
MANTDPLAVIGLYDGTSSKQPRLESLHNQHNVVVLSVRNHDADVELIVETNPVETAESADWEPVKWDDGSAVVFTDNGDAVLPACNNRIRVRMPSGGNATITLI